MLEKSDDIQKLKSQVQETKPKYEKSNFFDNLSSSITEKNQQRGMTHQDRYIVSNIFLEKSKINKTLKPSVNSINRITPTSVKRIPTIIITITTIIVRILEMLQEIKLSMLRKRQRQVKMNNNDLFT